MKLTACLLTALSAYALHAKPTQSLPEPETPMLSRQAVPAASAFWNTAASKAYTGGEQGISDLSAKPDYKTLANAWAQ